MAATWYRDDSAHVSWKCAQVTGKAGENGQKFRWDGRQLTLGKTVGSRVWWHTQGSSKWPALDLGWGSSSKTAPGSLSTGSPAGRALPHGDGSMYSQVHVRWRQRAAAPYPSVAVRDRGHWKGVAGSGGARWKVTTRRVERCSHPGASRNRANVPARSPEITCAGLFQDSDFAGHLEDSKSTSGGILCIFGSHTFVPISWMCKKQTSVSHSSTEAEFISLDVGLRIWTVYPLSIFGT